MKKNSFYKKMMMSVAGAALVSVGLNQSPNNAFNSGVTEVSAAKKTKKAKTVGANSAVYQKKGKKMVKTKKTIKVGKKYTFLLRKLLKAKLTTRSARINISKLLMLMARPVKQAKRQYYIPEAAK